MVTDEALLTKAKKIIEDKIGWGDSSEWTNQDFVALSERIQEELSIPLSHVTLKRIWGKVKYESLPNTHTLNTLVQFAGYENWRAFKIRHGKEESFGKPPEIAAGIQSSEVTPSNKKIFSLIDILSTVLILISCLFVFVQAKKWQIDPNDYSFSSKKVVSVGVPNSVIFDYDASKSPTDIVIIQQSWESKRRTNVSKNDNQHTSIYYFPEYYRAKLIIGNQIVKEHHLFIQSDGWLGAVNTSPVPVYFKKEDFIMDGEMSLGIEKIREHNINLQPEIQTTLYANVRDFGEIYTDEFKFETRVRNDYREGSSACQKTNIYLLADEAHVGIPLSAKGCISDVEFMFAGTYLSGKKKDLSAFGTDFNDFVSVRAESSGGKGRVYLDNVLKYEIDVVKRSKIIGIYFAFEGTGSVDFVRLWNSKTDFNDQFD